MNIGMIVYSRTGHTYSVARKLGEALSAAGHTVNMERVEPARPVSLSAYAENVPLKTTPATNGYDALIFGSPVQGGIPAPPMAGFLDQIPSLEGQTVALLVTGVFPAAWGRDQTIAKMTEICASKGATVIGAGSVGWWSLARKRRIAEAVEHLVGLF